MIAKFAKRSFEVALTLFFVLMISFSLVRLIPGDPVLLMLGERGANPEVYASMQKSLGLHLPLWQQFLNYLNQILHFDFGQSIVSRQPVYQEFFQRFPATIELSLIALIWSTSIGLLFGMIAAIKKNTFVDTTLMTISLAGYSMPIFWWGLVLILISSVHLGLTPVSGRISVEYWVPSSSGFLLIDSWFSDRPWQAFTSALHHLILPAIVLGTIPMATIARMTRSSLLEVWEQDYMRLAQAKGLSLRTRLFKHALKNALIPIITVIGLQLGTLLTGAILTETIFSWPGIGKWMVSSLHARDYPVIQAGIFLLSTLIIFINLFIEWTYLFIDPRLRKKIVQKIAKENIEEDKDE